MVVGLLQVWMYVFYQGIEVDWLVVEWWQCVDFQVQVMGGDYLVYFLFGGGCGVVGELWIQWCQGYLLDIMVCQVEQDFFDGWLVVVYCQFYWFMWLVWFYCFLQVMIEDDQW